MSGIRRRAVERTLTMENEGRVEGLQPAMRARMQRMRLKKPKNKEVKSRMRILGLWNAQMCAFVELTLIK